MTKFIKVINNKVTDIVVAEQDFIDTLSDKDFYIKDDGTITNRAGIGSMYDTIRNAFISPKPFSSWTLNETTCQWEAPTSKPDDGKIYVWNEGTKSWDEA
tara:strand:+ start:1468 stop:1767 length:300 start_codon:yes stop_codon:yes gene_type:complete